MADIAKSMTPAQRQEFEWRLVMEQRIRELALVEYPSHATYPRDRMKMEDSVTNDIRNLDNYRTAIVDNILMAVMEVVKTEETFVYTEDEDGHGFKCIRDIDEFKDDILAKIEELK